MGYSKVCINTDSQIVVNAVNGKIVAPKDIINLVEDIKESVYIFRISFWISVVEMIIKMLM